MKLLTILLTLISPAIFAQQTISEFCKGKPSKAQTEGLVSYYSNLIEDQSQHCIWFRDSTVVFEIQVHYSESMDTITTSEGIRVSHFTVLHLPTMRAQDYMTFSDTSQPVTSYRLEDDNIISWSFYLARKNMIDINVNSLISLPDTTIDGNLVKRFTSLAEDNNLCFTATYGLTKSNEEDLFHLTPSMDLQYPGCKVTYVLYELPDCGLTFYNKIAFLRDMLTPTEHRVFDKWESNLNSTNSLKTLKEARKIVAKAGTDSDQFAC